MRVKKVFLIIGIVLLSAFGISIFQEFMANHTYYNSMFGSWQNWKIIIWALIATAIPLWYLLKCRVFSLKKFFVWTLPLGLLLFSIAHTVIKEGIVGGSAGFLLLCINTLLLYFLGMYFILGSLALGTWISEKFIKFSETRWQEMMINFGLGLGALLLIVYVLTMATVLFPVLIWILFLGLGGMIWLMKWKMNVYKDILSPIFDGFKFHILQQSTRKWMGLIFLGIAIMYYFYGFNLSFIPYSTAWDANHAYMYVPKVLAENHGVLRGNIGFAQQAPYLRHIFITFRFSLIQPIKSWFLLGADTIAVAMNFLSGLFVLVFGIGLIKEVLDFFSKKDDEKGLSLGFGWTGLLFRLTSGMGAFLVFVDNKTDLGVMALTILAILSGFVFLKVVAERAHGTTKLDTHALKYVVISGVFFALASMSKPTAFIDIALFGILLFGLWIDILLSVGLGVMSIGAMGILKVANARDIMNTHLGKRVFLIGVLIVVIALLRMFWKNYQHIWAQKKVYLKYIGVWIAVLFGVLIVFKGPNMLATQIIDNTFSPSVWIKSILLGKQQTTLLATTADVQTLNAQTLIDQTQLNQNTTSLSLAACKEQTFSSGDLSKGLKKAVSGNEDVGRYVGYGRKEITRGGGISLGYYFSRLFFPVNDVCYGFNHDAKLLCKNARAINVFDLNTLKTLFMQVKKDGDAYNLLSGALASYTQKYPNGLIGAINPIEFRDNIVALRQYYQNHSIYTEAGKLEIPYRYIIPLNVVFNRSLQNLSSYYTDIGFVWLFMLVFIIMAVVYALVKKDKNLTVLSLTTTIGWAIWWVIGGGIVWYGIGLIMWTILTGALFIKALIHQDNGEDNRNDTLFYVFIGLFVVWGIIQLFFNFIRISSQGGSGPFERYKTGNGKDIEITEQLQQKEIVKSGYGWKDVFDVQFPHYNKFIDYVAERKNEDGVLIAGTYIQYFLKNQHYIKFDGMLDRFWEQNSDGNECKSYQRLKNANLKYLVIDPNIGTVVMGEGNESLFNRFFAKLDPVTKKIQEHGAISRLVQLTRDRYIKLFSTNNLGAKYAFTLSDETLQTAFGKMSTDELIFLRAKLSIARFFPDESEKFINFIAKTFTDRLGNGDAVGDIADVYGKVIDESKVLTLAIMLLQQQDSEQLQTQITNLTQDERLILTQYLGLVQLVNAQNPQYQEFLNNLMSQSLGGGSQLMVFELN